MPVILLSNESDPSIVQEFLSHASELTGAGFNGRDVSPEAIWKQAAAT